MKSVKLLLMLSILMIQKSQKPTCLCDIRQIKGKTLQGVGIETCANVNCMFCGLLTKSLDYWVLNTICLFTGL